MNHNQLIKQSSEFTPSNQLNLERRRASSIANGSASFSLIQTKPTCLESYSSSISSNSGGHLSASESISSKSANLIFIPHTHSASTPAKTQEELSSSSSSSSSASASPKSKSSSTSSVFAGLSVLSFSESNSIPSLSSSISYSDATELKETSNTSSSINHTSESVQKRPLIDLRKQFDFASITFSPSEISSINNKMTIKTDLISELIAPYKSKPFYGKDWLYAKLNDYITNKKTHDDPISSSASTSSGLSSYLQSVSSINQVSSCLILLGESGTGKSHLCCELKWPTNTANSDLASINKHLLNAYFLNWFNNSKQNHLKQFYLFLAKSVEELYDLNRFKRVNNLELSDFLKSSDLDDENDCTDAYVTKLANEFIENILKPVQNFKQQDKSLFFLLDGLDEVLIHAERLEPSKTLADSLVYPYNMKKKNTESRLSSAEMILMFLNKTFHFMPNWMNLILTCKPCNEANYLKKYLNSIKYDKMSMDKCINMDSLTPITSLISNSSSHNINSDNDSKVDSFNSSNSSHSISSFKTNSNLSSSLALTTDPVELCNAAHFANLKDIQTYILKRLDNDSILKKKFNKTNAIDMFNLLLIKSNFSVLYVEKVLDLILSDYISSNEIANIPATLNGLYLYLIETILSRMSSTSEEEPNAKELLYSILSVGLVEPTLFEKQNCFNRIVSRFTKLEFRTFEFLFELISPILFRQNYLKSDRLILFHSSLVEWLTDVKFCTLNYLVNLNEAHFTLSFYYLNKLKQMNKTAESSDAVGLHWTKFKYHLLNADSVLHESTLNYFYLLCESDYELSQLIDNLDEKFLQFNNSDTRASNDEKIIDYGKIFDDSFRPKSSLLNADTIQTNESIANTLFELVAKGDLKAIQKMLKINPSLETHLTKMTDAFDQTALIVAVKLNNYEMIEYLVKLHSTNLDHCDSSGWTSLRYSAWMGNENVVNILLESGASVDTCDSENRTALRAAVFSGHEHIVKLLLKYKANVNKCDTDNRSVLHVAVYMGHLALIEQLLLNGADINQQDSLGRGVLSTLLFSTVSNPQTQLEIADLLMKFNADVNQCDNENKTPLILAVIENNIVFTNMLIQNNADMDAIDNDGYTAITHAVKNNYFGLADLLLKQNAATHILDKEGRSILSIACSVGAKEVLHLLMERGLDEMHRDNFGWTPLHEASFAGYLEIAQMLLNYGSEIDAIDNEGKTSLFYACQEGHFSLVKLLIENFADANIKCHQGITPFRAACLENRLEICEYLLGTKTIDVNYLDPDSRTTLYCLVCSANRNIEMIKYLLENGASVNTIDMDGKTCMHIAASKGDLELFSLLVRYSSNLEATDLNGHTPLLTATVKDQLNIVKFLLNEKLCQIDHQDTQGATALSLASHKGNYDIVNELLQNGAQLYASKRNPIKIAHQNNHTEVVKLLQQWSALAYDFNVLKDDDLNKIYNTSVTRNSKSVDSFKYNSKTNKYANEKFVQSFTNRCVATPTTFSNYIKCTPSTSQDENRIQVSASCRIPNSISASPGTYDYDKLDDLNKRYLNKTNSFVINECGDESKDTLMEDSKSSKFKQVKDKFLKKSSTLIVSNSSLNSSKFQSNTPTTPSNKSVASFRLFISSLNGSNESNQKRQRQEKDSCLQTSASSSKLKPSKSITNSSFMQMIRKKLKFLKSPSHPNYCHQNFEDLAAQNEPIIPNVKQMHRSITDTIANNCYTNSKDTLTNSISFIKPKPTTPADDDVAHIFNRNSLNDCLNPRCSFRDCDSSSSAKKLNTNYSSYMMFNSHNSNSVGTSSSSSSSSQYTNSNDYYNKLNPINTAINTNIDNSKQFNKRPNCLPLNYFKKETSI